MSQKKETYPRITGRDTCIEVKLQKDWDKSIYLICKKQLFKMSSFNCSSYTVGSFKFEKANFLENDNFLKVRAYGNITTWTCME